MRAGDAGAIGWYTLRPRHMYNEVDDSMEVSHAMKVFAYTGLTRYGAVVTQIMVGVFMAGMTMFALLFSVFVILAGPSRWGLLLTFAWMLVIAWSVGPTLINAFPTVWLDENGLMISAFIVRRIQIPWHDVVAIVPSLTPFGDVVVQTRRITPFHRLIGLIYARKALPSFMIRANIENHDELLWEIGRRAKIAY